MQLQQGSQIAKFHLFRKCGLLALNLASIFEKLLDQKTFIYLRLVAYSQYQKTADMDFVRSFFVPYKLSSRFIIF